MRSNITALHDDTDISLEYPSYDDIVTLIEDELTALARRSSVIRDHDRVRAGDIVTLSMQGPTPRFTRQHATVVIGLGLLDPQFESALIDVPLDTETVVESSDGGVSVHVQAARYQDVPPITDDLVARAATPASTVAEFRRARETKLRADRLADHVEQVVWDHVENVVGASDIAYDPAEVDELVTEEFVRCRALAADQGLVFDEMTPEQLGERTGVESIEEFRAMVTDIARWRIATGLLGARLIEQPAEDLSTAELEPLAVTAIDHYRARIVARITARQGAQA